MADKSAPATSFPHDPLDGVVDTANYRRRLISGILESYNGNYDFMVEAVQNAVDALEDAKLMELKGPFLLDITVDLKENSFSVLDTGVGMDSKTLVLAYKPHVSFKDDPQIRNMRGSTHSYRGYKGVGLAL